MSDETGKSGASEGTHAAEKFSGAAADRPGGGGDRQASGPDRTGGGEIAPDPLRAAKVGTSRATVEAVMSDLVSGFGSADAPEQSSLMLDEVDEQAALFAGPVKHVASTMAEASGRGRGRPKGSQNKSSWRDTMLRMGYRHPGQNLLDIANSDPHELAAELSDGSQAGRVTPSDAFAMIIKANAELLPYFESKRPTEVHVEERKLGVMQIVSLADMERTGGRYVEAFTIDNETDTPSE